MVYKNLPMSAAFKQQFKDYVWRERTTMSGIIREEIENYANGQPAHTLTEQTFDAEVKYMAPDKYADALARAKREGVALTDVIRQAVARRVQQE